MDADAIFARCAARRRSLADVLDSLDDDQLATPSLCVGWDVRTVAAHLTTGLVVSPVKMGLAMARNGGNFDRASNAVAVELARQPATATAATLREQAGNRFTPPLHGPAAPLTELIVHTVDMLQPLGRPVEVAADEAAAVFAFLTGRTMFFIPRGLLAGVRIAPTDVDGAWGAGSDVTGRALDILMTIFGRAPFRADVAGPGAELLVARRWSRSSAPD